MYTAGMESSTRFFPGTSQSRKRLVIVACIAIITYALYLSSPVSKGLYKIEDKFELGYIGSSPLACSKDCSQRPTGNNLRLPAGGAKAEYLSPLELMKRPLAPAQKTIPKLFHQSWSTTELPKKFKQWSDGCREQHPDWEWVLWTDDDNEEMIRQFLPWLQPAFDKLKGPIYRADLARHAYMILFGGIYADLDMDCLIPTEDGVFKEHNVSTIPHMSAIKQLPAPDAKGQPSARLTFFGRMGTDEGFEHGIPNAWMAAPPAHPFYMLEMEWIRDKIMNGDINLTPETITGPIALRNAIGRYSDEKYHTGGNFEQFFKDNPSVTSDPTMVARVKATEILHNTVLLPFQYIYPYSWARDGDAVRDMCWSALDTFDAERCKQILAVDRWPSTTITFWSHTWEHDGHQSENLGKIS